MTAQTIATAEGTPYLLDVEGSRGDFLTGFFFPEAWDSRPPEQIEAEGFGFDGVLMDEDGNPPPDGQDISWVMTFQLLKPLWPVEALKQEDSSPWMRTRFACAAGRLGKISEFCIPAAF